MLMMENAEVEENLLSIGEPKLHGGMCKSLSAIYAKVLGIFPELEAARPRSTSGIQALCALHIALEKTKNILQHCAECSKLYLAITGDSIVLKFERARCALEDSLKRVEDIVPQSIGGQGRKFNGNDNNELESFHQAASRLGITSSRAALRERRALKKLVERARAEEDKRKESIVAYLLHLIRKYSKLFRSEFSDDNDSQGSTPCSPTVQGSFEDGIGPGGNIIHAFDRQFSKLSSFNFKPNFRRSDQMPVPPEELRCPISLQLMYDPVIIASGQTYERICIEKWFSDGHNTCPKTQQELPHLGLTPNYCVKGLVASWCEQNGLPIPDGPPESLDLNYWRLALSESESTNSKSTGSIASCKFKGVKVVPLEDSGIIEEAEGNEVDEPVQEDELQVNSFERYEDFLAILNKEDDFRKKCRVVEQIRHLLKDDEEIRIYMGANGFIEALLGFLECAVQTRNEIAQEIGTMALFNLGVNNNRNKELMLAAGVLPLLGRMVATSSATIAATALYLNLSCLEEAKPVIGSCEAVPFLIGVLQHETDTQCKLDALHALFNLSTNQTNIPHLLSAGILDGLKTLMSYTDDHTTEKCIAVLINLSLSKSAKEEIMSSPGLISRLATVLDIGEPLEQEQAAACLLILCNGNEKCSQMVLQEGVIPSLVSISVNGTMRGKQKAQKLLMLFREQRQREPSLVQTQPRIEKSETLAVPPEDSKPLCKSTSRKKLGKAWSFLWKNKSFSVYQC
ncbi:U-box domain-containing protein 6-like isoform X2 [Nicotiana tabacum]|uniref:RING-type E3 ubiquitin transferase n=1 Tax=Nicotiana tabacum TaxID=4097 RepID=A0A1S4A967_TOBAC|nr:PREDICTED: U-box domain-containing protein 45-like isoform X2 [Nicotiana tabacum]